MNPVAILLAISLAAAPPVATPAHEWTRAQARAFLAEHRARAGVVETRSGLQYRIVEEGAGCRPKPGSVVHVRYQVRLGDEPAVVDDSAKYGPAIVVPLREMIPAWKEGIPLMREGSTWDFAVPPALAYGENGSPPTVPAHAPLSFHVELVKAPDCADEAEAAGKAAKPPMGNTTSHRP